MKSGLTKEQSKALYGVASLLMLFHHLYCIPERLDDTYFSVIDFFLGPGSEMFLAWLCKICVAIYAFISGYAYCKNCQNKDPLTVSGKQGFFFLRKYWLVCIVFLPLGLLLGKLEFRPKLLLQHLTLVNTTCNMEWWYAEFYIKLLLCLPLFHYCFTQCRQYFQKLPWGKYLAACVGFVLVYIFRIWLSTPMNYMLIAAEGYFAAEFGVFEWLSGKHSQRKPIRLLQWAGLFALCVGLRCMFTREADSSTIDLVVTLPLVYCIVTAIQDCSPVFRAMTFLGKYSTYIWLTHTFFIYYYFQPFSMISRNSLIMFLQLILTSVLTAAVLTRVEYLLLNLWNRLYHHSLRR